MDNATLINSEEHKYWNSDSADYWVSQKPALDRLLAPWARLLLEAAGLSGGEQIADIGCGTGATTLKFAASKARSSNSVTLCFWNCASCTFVTGWNRSPGRKAGITVARATSRLRCSWAVLDFRNTGLFSTGRRNRSGLTAISGLKTPTSDQHSQ